MGDPAASILLLVTHIMETTLPYNDHTYFLDSLELRLSTSFKLLVSIQVQNSFFLLVSM